jgi:hypothetical protein
MIEFPFLVEELEDEIINMMSIGSIEEDLEEDFDEDDEDYEKNEDENN